MILIGLQDTNFALPLFSLKKLLFEDFPVSYVENADFFKRHTWLAFERHLLFQHDTEKITRDDRLADMISMYSFDRGTTGDTFRFNCLPAMRKDSHPHRCRFFRFLANDVFMIKRVLDLDKFPLGGQFVITGRCFLSCHNCFFKIG